MTRKQLAGIVLAMAAALGLAASAAPAAIDPAAGRWAPVQRVDLPAEGIRDEAAMVLVGAALIALGAAVRRAG